MWLLSDSYGLYQYFAEKIVFSNQTVSREKHAFYNKAFFIDGVAIGLIHGPHFI